ncbi:MAG: alanine racemase [Lachnospiraceae bacterium]|nr:alanine racemase [Lachnospiraceae bacterium]
MKQHSRIRAEIDLSAIRENYLSMKALVRNNAKMFAVIKTDGYGHGALEIAQELQNQPELAGFCIATVEEGILLREAGIRNRLLILGYTFPETYEEIVRYDLTPAVFTREVARDLSRAAEAANKKINIHLAVDTGMGRIGFSPDQRGIEEGLSILSYPGLVCEGIFTHFARADEKDKAFAGLQFERFKSVLKEFEQRGVTFSLRHCANSASIMELPETHLDAVRGGITLYGLWPSDEVDKSLLPLRSGMRLVSHIAHIKTVPPGTPISYGGTYVTKKESVIATIPAGYGDGYPRSLSNQGRVLICGKAAPIRGRVCMDQFMVDISGIPEAKLGDEVVLVGESAGSRITMEELGALSGRFNYELACDIGKRVPRVFYRDGAAVSERMF